jgi:acetyl esterase/lipase
LGGYRLAPEFHLADQMADARAGLAAGLAALASAGIRADRVIAGGQSAGAHLAGLLVYDRGQDGGFLQSLFGGFFSISGPLDFSACTHPSLQHMIADLLGPESSRERADPISHLRGDERVPALLIHGDRDPLVDLQNTLTFAERLRKGGSSPVEVHLVQVGHHADLAALFLKDLSVTLALERWLNRVDHR